MKFNVILFFPLISDLEGVAKQVIWNDDVEAETDEEAVLQVMEMDLVNCGEGFWALPVNAALLQVRQLPVEGGNGEDADERQAGKSA